MKILLTGSTGMAGRNILDHPTARQHDWLLPKSNDLNLLDYSAVRHYLNIHRPDFIIHAAGLVGGIQANIREPVRFLIENLDMGRNILLAAANLGVTRLLNFGSSCMYPKDCTDALSETDVLSGPLEPTNEGYALAKITVARLAEYISRENNILHYKTIIPCNLYGPYDKFDPRWSHMIPAVIHKLHQAKVRGDESVEIWGTGQARREFLYSGDFADAVMRALSNFDTLPRLMNIGLGYDYSIDEYYQIIANVIGYQGSFHHDNNKPVGMHRKLSNIERAVQWGWKARHNLEEGLSNTYQYYLNHIISGR